MTVRLAIPNKGRLHRKALEVLEAAGIDLRGDDDRRLYAESAEGRLRVLFARADDIAGFVSHGAADVGITGWDLVRESGADVEELVDLGFGSCRLVVAVPEDLEGPLEDGARVATSFPNLTRRHFEDRGRDVEIVQVSGAAEAAPHIGVADAIVDLTSSGRTLERNRLVPRETILESSARLVANPEALAGSKARGIEDLAFAVESVIHARGKKYLMADVPEEVLDDVAELLPGIEGPTVVPIQTSDWVAIQVVVDESDVYDKIHALKKLGAKGILVTPIERLVP